jgi:hypothetical protein
MNHRTGWNAALLAGLALAAGCSLGKGLRQPEAPAGDKGWGLTFGAPRAEVEKALKDAKPRPDPSDRDALLLERCPGAPVDGPCQLHFGPGGLYALEQRWPLADVEQLVKAVERSFGPPRRAEAGAAGGVVASWEPKGWSVAIHRLPGTQPPAAGFRAEFDRAAPPVAAGVPLGRLREAVERILAGQGAVEIQRDDEATSYLGCPLGVPEAVSCTVSFGAGGRAAAVTEVLPAQSDDQVSMEAWRARAAEMEKEIGRPPVLQCPGSGPDRVAGDCTASWASDRLVVVVGAHRNQGGQHRGPISIYVGFSSPLVARGQED